MRKLRVERITIVPRRLQRASRRPGMKLQRIHGLAHVRNRRIDRFLCHFRAAAVGIRIQIDRRRLRRQPVRARAYRRRHRETEIGVFIAEPRREFRALCRLIVVHRRRCVASTSEAIRRVATDVDARARHERCSTTRTKRRRLGRG